MCELDGVFGVVALAVDEMETWCVDRDVDGVVLAVRR